MTNPELVKILNGKKIEIVGDITFSEENEIQFLNNLEEILKNHSEIKQLNQDLANIILKLNTKNEELIQKFKKFNWQDFEETIKDSNENTRKQNIYENFIEFLHKELEIALPQNHKKATPNQKDIFKLNKDLNIEEDKFTKAKKYDIDILFDYTTPSKKISVNDFVLYFNRRLQYFTTLLKSRPQMDNTMRISQLKDLNETNTKVSIIGLVANIENTKSGHLILTIEDKSGQIKCLINKNKFTKDSDKFNQDIKTIIDNLCLDEGIGIIGKVGKDTIWVDELISPNPPNNNQLKKTDKEHYIVFMSDLHFGAKVFVDDAFERFLDWINGRTNNEALNEIASKVKYIIIPGDIIEGIGIYPDQGKDARILSAELQYHEATRYLSRIPKDKCIIITPGNHDTNRLSEPQPKLTYSKAYSLYNLDNVLHLSNPCEVRLFGNDPSGGLTIYMYHGGSLFYYADNVQHLRQKGGAKTPEEVVKYLLEKRHLAPSHGATLYVPDSQNDPLVIKHMPDFFAVGHTHKLSLANYKGCTIVSCGCWVEMSDYQEKMGMFPDIGKIVLVNTKTRKPNIINFYKDKDEKNKEDKTEQK